MSSIRWRLYAGVFLSLLVVFGAGGTFLYGLVRARLVGELDRGVEALMRANVPPIYGRLEGAGLGRPDGGGPDPAGRPDRPGEEGGRGGRGPGRGPRRPPGPYGEPAERDDFLFQAWLGDQRLRSDSLAGDLVRPTDGAQVLRLIADEEEAIAFDWITLPDGAVARGSVFHFEPFRPPRPGTFGAPEQRHADVVFARDASEVLGTLAEVRTWLFFTALAGIGLSLGTLFAVVRTSLRPMDRVRRRIGELDVDSLASPLDVDGVPDELSPMVTQLNGLLARLRRAFEREQSFTSDVAHELRTPLAGLRATLEVIGSRPRERADYEEAVAQCLDITVRMQTLIESLMDLTRAGAGAGGEVLEPVSLCQVVEDGRPSYEGKAGTRQLGVDVQVDPDHIVMGDPALVARVVSNALDNAVSYADEGSRVEVRSERDGATCVLSFANDCARLSPKIADRAFDAFWRADAARAATGVHAGVGLSLCRRIVERLQGTIDCTAADDRFVLRVRLPAATR